MHHLCFSCLKLGKKNEGEESSALPLLTSISPTTSSEVVHNPLAAHLERAQEETANLRDQLTEILLASVEEKHKQSVLEERYEVEKIERAALQSKTEELHNALAFARTQEATLTSEINQLNSKLQKHEELKLEWGNERELIKLQLDMERDLLKPWMRDAENARTLQEIEDGKKIQEEMRIELNSVAGCACGGIQLRSRYSAMDLALNRAEEWNAELKYILQTATTQQANTPLPPSSHQTDSDNPKNNSNIHTVVILSTPDMEDLLTELQQQCTDQLSVFRKELQEMHSDKSRYDESITDLQLKLQQQCNAIDERDRKRKAWVHAVDTSLSLLAQDQRIQEALRRPLVMKALQFWVGGQQVRPMQTSENDEKLMKLIQADEGVHGRGHTTSQITL